MQSNTALHPHIPTPHSTPLTTATTVSGVSSNILRIFFSLFCDQRSENEDNRLHSHFTLTAPQSPSHPHPMPPSQPTHPTPKHPLNKIKIYGVKSEILIKYKRIKWTPSRKAWYFLPRRIRYLLLDL